MDSAFFERPILNSPYEYPARHWELDAQGQPTQQIIERRRLAEFITPIPKPRKRKGGEQASMVFDEGKGLSTAEQQYDPTPIINALREHVDHWRKIPNPNDWKVTPETARLLQHWRSHQFSAIRPFFCQIEAVETAIWLTEVAPNEKAGRDFLEHMANANHDANPELLRLALKLATGAGKTTVMAMLIAWQTINAVRRPNSKRFTRGFLIVTPGITIRDRLRVLQPNDPDSYYASRELVPSDMLADLDRAKIVITNYHAFKLRERMELSKGGRALLQGRTGPPVITLETEGQMMQRVMPDLMGMKNILAINDEAHHCYREKPGHDDEVDLKGDERKEAENNAELKSVVDACNPAPQTMFRLAIEEMEAWYFGDRNALLSAYPRAKREVLDKYVQDSQCDTWELLADALYPGGSLAIKRAGWPLPGQIKHEWAEKIGPYLSLEENTSPSFNKLLDGLTRLMAST
jgi:type III restriction enzyme